MKKKHLIAGVILLGALAVAAGVAGLALRPGVTADPASRDGDGDSSRLRRPGTDGTLEGDGTTAGVDRPLPRPAVDGSGPDPETVARRMEVLARQDPEARRRAEADPYAVKDRPPGPLPEAGIGPDHSEKWTEADAVRVEEIQVRISENPLKEIRWNSRSLKAAAEELGRLGGVLIEIEGEDLADEPVTFDGKDVPVMDVLMRIAETRHLRFQIRPDRIVIKR